MKLNEINETNGLKSFTNKNAESVMTVIAVVLSIAAFIGLLIIPFPIITIVSVLFVITGNGHVYMTFVSLLGYYIYMAIYMAHFLGHVS